MNNAIVTYDCSLKEAWKQFIERMKSERWIDIDDEVFVYDKTDDTAWVVEECELDDFAEELWDCHSLWEKGANHDDHFEDYVIIQLVHYDREDKRSYPNLFKKGKRTSIPGVYRFTHHFTVDFSPTFGSTT